MFELTSQILLILNMFDDPPGKWMLFIYGFLLYEYHLFQSFVFQLMFESSIIVKSNRHLMSGSPSVRAGCRGQESALFLWSSRDSVIIDISAAQTIVHSHGSLIIVWRSSPGQLQYYLLLHWAYALKKKPESSHRQWCLGTHGTVLHPWILCAGDSHTSGCLPPPASLTPAWPSSKVVIASTSLLHNNATVLWKPIFARALEASDERSRLL